jgi:PAS domain S-box-containing protein
MTGRPVISEQLDRSLLHALVENAVDGIITIDDRGIVQMLNPAAERLFGYRADEVIGQNVSMLMPEPYRREHDGYVQRYLETGERKIIGIGREVAGRRKDGTTFPMYLSVAEVYWDERWLFAGIVHDLSERKRVEEQLRKEKDKVQRYLDIAGAMIVAVDADQKIALINKKGCEILGCVSSEITGKNWYDQFAPPAVREERRATFERVMRGDAEPEEHNEYTVVTTRGDERVIAWHNALLKDDDGHIIGILRSGEDITQLKRAVSEMQRMRSYLKNIIDSMPSMLVGVDPEGRITEWNHRAEQFTGVVAGDAIGKSFGQLLPHLISQLDNVREAVRRREPVRTERLASEADGEVQYSDIVVYPLIANGAVGAVIRVDDVTNRVRIEQMMVQTEKMMSVGGLAAGMAHEINNPLSAIMQGCQNIIRRLSPDLPGNRNTAQALDVDLDKVRMYLEQRGILGFVEDIRSAATRATRIVADMLAFSRRSDAHFVPTHMEEMLETVVRLAASDYDLKKKYDFRQVEIVRDYDNNVGQVYCDRTEIEQVFLNVIKNAAQAMAESGKPPPYTITLRTRGEPEHVRVEIEDNGPGMDEKTCKRVFEPFFTTKPVGVGTGLGLSVSYFIVTEHHGGNISVSSTPGLGTCFVIRLPLRERASP